MLFGKLKKAIRKFFMLDEPSIEAIDFALHKTLIEASRLQTEKVEPGYPPNPPTCHMIRYPEKIRKPGSQAIHKVSPKHFKPRPAHEKKLLNPKAKLEEEEN